MRRLALLPALLLNLAACGDDSGGDANPGDSSTADIDGDAADAADEGITDTTLEPLSTQQWCIRSNTAWCDWMYRCLTPEELATAEASLGVNEESCASALTADCQQRTMVSVAEGRQSFDGAAAAVCIAALADEPCGTWTQLVAGDVLNPPECHGITHGSVAPGDECANTLDCEAEDAWCWKEEQDGVGYCTDTLGGDAFQWECEVQDAPDCPGRVCNELPENASDWTGVCTANCRADRNCGPGAGCFSGEDDARVCLGLCAGPDDCAEGLECMDVGGRSACFVRPR